MKILSPVYVLSANNAGDGGGGLFVSNNSSTGRRRREGFRHFKNPLGQDVELKAAPVQSKVKWFGAMGDGVANDAKAILLAIHAAESISQSLSEVNQGPSRLGGFYSNPTVLIADGDYHVTGSVNANTGLDAGEYLITFQGAGRAVLSTQDPTLNRLRIGPRGNVKNLIFSGRAPPHCALWIQRSYQQAKLRRQEA